MTEVSDIPKSGHRSFGERIKGSIVSKLAHPKVVTPVPKPAEVIVSEERVRNADKTVKREWLEAFISANNHFPQVDFGINTYLLSSIFISPPSDWIGFGYSELSPDQVGLIGKSMSDSHRAMGISRVFEEADPKKNEISVPVKRMTEFWRDIRDQVLWFLLSAYNIGEYPYAKINANNLSLLQTAYETDARRTEEIREAIAGLRRTMESPQVRELARVNRLALKNKPSEQVLEESKEIQWAMKNLLVENHRASGSTVKIIRLL